jgi:hypothetical protein
VVITVRTFERYELRGVSKDGGALVEDGRLFGEFKSQGWTRFHRLDILGGTISEDYWLEGEDIDREGISIHLESKSAILNEIDGVEWETVVGGVKEALTIGTTSGEVSIGCRLQSDTKYGNVSGVMAEGIPRDHKWDVSLPWLGRCSKGEDIGCDECEWEYDEVVEALWGVEVGVGGCKIIDNGDKIVVYRVIRDLWVHDRCDSSECDDDGKEVGNLWGVESSVGNSGEEGWVENEETVEVYIEIHEGAIWTGAGTIEGGSKFWEDNIELGKTFKWEWREGVRGYFWIV